MHYLFSIFCCVTLSIISVSADYVYNTSAGPVKDKINVHLVAHTHDDVGWLKTLDQYYIGSNNSIQRAAVQYILDSVVEKLVENPDRKFIYVEQAFFQRWWREQTHAKKRVVRSLISSGQLEFINGGWCMHDEAAAHYLDMIDQTTLGHRYIKKLFGKVPRVTWQLDPFGHSAVQGYLLSAEAGFDAVFFSRADWQDVAKRRKDRSMEFLWRGSKSLGATSEIFGGAMHHHYDPPEGFRYDIANPDPPIQDDWLLYDVNVEERVQAFVDAAKEQALQFRTNHIMWAMGEDFAYSNAQTWYKNMDKLIHYVNKDGRVNALYSTPSIYVDCKHAANETWPIKTGDFFPYADSPHNFWTGYFTSRPALKGYIRSVSAYLHAAQQLEVFVGRDHRHSTDQLEESVSVAQHHDAVSGTAQQHVANDYAKRLHVGDVETRKVFSSALSAILSKKSTKLPRHVNQSEARRASLLQDPTPSKHLEGKKHHFQRCSLLNISYCPTSETDISGHKSLIVVAYNPLAWSRKEIVKFPVSSPHVAVTTHDGSPVESQVIAAVGPTSHESRAFYAEAHDGAHPTVEKKRAYNLVFVAVVPPLGLNTYLVKAVEPGLSGAAFVSTEEAIEDIGENGNFKVENGRISLTFHPETGLLSQLVDLHNEVTAKVKQEFFWYNASNGIEAGPQASGAYIFRPNSSDAFSALPNNTTVKVKVFRGPLVTEVHQTFSPWISQVVRIFRGSSKVEFNYKVGPIPILDDFGKEVITRISTDIASNKTFFTDSNGRDFLKRVVDHRDDWTINVTDPVAGNYYPVNSGIFITDTEDQREVSVLVDRSVGGSSLRSGEIEIMLHRRLLYDDHKGVAEPLNETVCVGSREAPQCQGLMSVGSYVLNLSPPSVAPRWRRTHIQQILSPLQLSFKIEKSKEGNDFHEGIRQPTFSAVKSGFELPPNVALITLQEQSDGSILLRLAHLYEIDEDEEYSALVTVDISQIFAESDLLSVDEVTLTANQYKKDVNPLKWNAEEISSAENMVRGRVHEPGSPLVELGPMEIRTFFVKLA